MDGEEIEDARERHCQDDAERAKRTRITTERRTTAKESALPAILNAAEPSYDLAKFDSVS
jgi:hypothetical protein